MLISLDLPGLYNYDYDPQEIMGDDHVITLIEEIDFTHITDPDDPRFKDIEKIHCFSYPITTTTLTTDGAGGLYEEYRTLLEEMIEYQSNKPTGVTWVLNHQ